MPFLTLRRTRYLIGRLRQHIGAWLLTWDRLNTLLLLLSAGISVYDFGFPKSAYAAATIGSLLFTMAVLLLISKMLRLAGSLLYHGGSGHDKVSLRGQVILIGLLGAHLLLGGLLPDVVLRWWPHLMLLITGLVRLSQGSSILSEAGIEPALLFTISFAVMILVGTGLLLLPNCTYGSISVVDALFISTSAICVTGLSTVDVEFTFTHTGKLVLLMLIQIGGLGIMTLTSFLGAFFTGGSGLKHRLLVREMIAGDGLTEAMTLLRNVVLVTFIIEAIGAVFIYLSVGQDVATDLGQRIWFSVFHAISAFCNAGFSTLSPGLAHPALSLNAPFLLSISGLIIIGGIGFPILFNYATLFGMVARSRFRWLIKGVPVVHHARIINMQTRIVLATTVFLLIFGTVMFYMLEGNGLFMNMDVTQHWVSAFFMSVSPRTAGFNSVQLTEATAGSVVVMYFLMWVGGSPASTAGGIKTTTFALAMSNIVSLGKDKQRIELFGRELPSANVRRAFAVVTLSVVFIGTGVLILSITEESRDLGTLVFECISAFATVGLTLGLTPTLSSGGKLVVITLMFLGRVGAFTVIAGLIPDLRNQRYRYPQENIMIT